MTLPECGLLSNPPVIQRELFGRLHPDSRDLITGWATRALTEAVSADRPSHFEGFIYLWFAVNGWGACVAEADKDWRWVDAVAGDPDLSRTFDGFLRSDPRLRETAQVFAALWPIFRSSEIRRRRIQIPTDYSRSRRVQAYFDQDLTGFQPSCWEAHESRPPLDWAHTFKTLYRVRCNLFHGEKTLDSENDRQIVRAAYDVLALFAIKADLFR